ncbi:hypothetical protein SOVF_005270 [Spinacia oleracea]|nr:hypothetical protein SOVF_005270 [Spinacia oleracea]
MMEALYVEAAKAITKLVVTRPVEQAKLAWGIKHQFEKLRDEFTYIQAFLQDNERLNKKYRGDSQIVNAWLRKVMNLAYLADDVMDDYAYEILRRRSSSWELKSNNNNYRPGRKALALIKLKKRSFKIKCRNYSTLSDSNPLAFSFRMSRKVKHILLSFDDLYKDAKKLGIRPAEMAADDVRGVSDKGIIKRNIDNCLDEVRELAVAHRLEFVGRQRDKKELTTLLCDHNNDEEVSTIAIVGMGGLGKTTLARQLYEYEAITGHFTERIRGTTGSMILVTTRNKDIARMTQSRYMHQLTGLSDEESWAFFVQKAFPKGIATFDPGLEEIGRKIVNNCKGLPLAINVIGGLLRTKTDLCEWKSIEKSAMWNLPQENNDILPSLLLSFNYLSSPSLKQCFAYCAIYPKEVLIDREDLINLWNAQGFLHCQSEERNLTPEELGGKYVDILFNNSLLQAETRRSFDGEVTEYRMHYLVHDMALYISRHDWMIWKGVERVSNPSGGRHLAIFPEDDVITSEAPAEKMAWLRTLHSTISLPMDLLVHTKNLRVLKLASTGLKKVSPAIGRLSHLRYVDLSHNPIVMLPESITSLYHLQTLRVFGYKLRELPQRLYRLVNLRHLHLTSRSWCLPRGIERLKALQTLPMLELNEGSGWEIGELEALGVINGLLSISGLEHVKNKGEAEKASIFKKLGISEMQLIWGWGRANNHLDVLDALQPPPNLKLLMITGYDGPNFPPWMMSMMTFSETSGPRPFNNLVHIELLYCRSCQQLPVLGHLPCLRDLSMYSMWSVAAIGDEFYHSSNDTEERAPALFPALRKLNIVSFENLTNWEPPLSRVLGTVTTLATLAFPLLELLRIEHCDKLVQTPTNFPSLRHLWVKSIRGPAVYNVISGISNALTSLNIDEAPELSRLPDELIDSKSLEELTLRCCPDLQSLPDRLGTQLTSLLRLSIVECPELRKIPASMGDCLSLKKLCIRDCHNLEGIPDLSQLIHIEDIEINGCGKLTCLPRGLQILPCLNSLSIGGFKSLDTESTSSVTSQLLFPALKLLRIINDDSTEQVPEWIGNLSLLQKLELKLCKNLIHLPSHDVILRMTRLRALVIKSCPLLQERCAKDNGPEWDKISHIRLVRVNSQTIQEISA